MKNDPRSTEELIRLAIAANEDTCWDFVSVLQFRATNEVLESALELCQKGDSNAKSIGAAILGQLGIPTRAFPNESFSMLLKLLETEVDAGVLCSVGIALGHLKDSRAIEPLIRLIAHPNAEVRYGVTLGLSGHDETSALNALIELSSDEDRNVRDWATFELGSISEIDTPEIREALLQRLNDKDFEIRGEALVGLALRGDEKVIPPLLYELSSESVSRLAVEAAREISNPRVQPILIELRDWWDVDQNLLEEAIKNCSKST
jgi:HEAT repeat protein